MTLADSPNAISSPVSADGLSHSKWPVGQMMLPFGPEVVPASHSAPLESERESKTTDTYGRSSGVSSMSASLQRSLESKLRQRMDGIGCPMYALTWKHWVMRSGQPICALRASVRRTSAKGFSGWPTATSTDAIKGGKVSPRKNMMGLTEMAHQAGWPTAAARDWKNGKSNQHGKNSRPLNEVAMLAGWPTPDANAATRGIDHGEGWQRESGVNRASTINMAAGWATPKASEAAGGFDANRVNRKGTGAACLRDQAIGTALNGCHAATEKPGQLNPVFVCWLMGYPGEWLRYVDWETRSSRKSLRSSSQR